MKKILLALALLILLGLAGGYGLFNSYLNSEISKPAQLTITDGMTLRGTLEKLEKDGVINRALWLYAYARLAEKTSIRKGSYAIDKVDTPLGVLDKIHRGVVQTESFTLSEGMNRWEVRDYLAETDWIAKGDFEKRCDDSAFLKKFQIPGPTCDGYLYPETYTFARGVSADEIFKNFFELYRKNFQAATAKGSGPLNFGERELLTLASIIEKETGAADERPRIACLFYNRLKAKPVWKLQTDPTVIYAATLLDPNFDGNIRHYHLRQMDHPYNTYMRYGLPPGPIASPGRAAMDAVVSPSQCGDFFFVSMNNGRHVFCPTLDCHNKAVKKWQIDYFRKK